VTIVTVWLREAASDWPGATFAPRFQCGALPSMALRGVKPTLPNPSVSFRRTRRSGPSRSGGPLCNSGVRVERELVWVRADPDRVQLAFPLESDPGTDQVLGEDPTLVEELVVLL